MTVADIDGTPETAAAAAPAPVEQPVFVQPKAAAPAKAEFKVEKPKKAEPAAEVIEEPVVREAKPAAPVTVKSILSDWGDDADD